MILGLGQDTTDLTTDDGSSDDFSSDLDYSLSSGSGSPNLDVGSTALLPTDDVLANGQLTNVSTPTINLPGTSASSGASTDPLTAVLTALGVGAASVATSTISSAALQQTNANRLAEGLPPLSATGAVMTAAQMAAAGYSTTQIAAVSSQLAGSSSTLLLFGAVLVGLLLVGKSRG